MKKTMVILLPLLVSTSVNAQLIHTKWKGNIKGDNPQESVLKFSKDTVILYAADGSVIETMICKITGSTFTVEKIAGQAIATPILWVAINLLYMKEQCI